MSVLVFNNLTKKYLLFVKGAPEKIHHSSAVNFAYFDLLLKKVSLNGFRAIGLSYREVSN